MGEDSLPSPRLAGGGTGAQRQGEGESEALPDSPSPWRRSAPPVPPPAKRGEGSVRAVLATAARTLAAIAPTPRLDAELLMAHALGVSREELLLRHLDAPAPFAFAPFLARRIAHEPVAYITGTRDFWTLSLAVGPGVLIPRPDSETLIEAALAHFAGTPGPRDILDLGTGSGALLLAALSEWPEARGIGVDRSAAALAWAERNAARLGLADRTDLILGDWTAKEGTFDLVLCNPPYVEAGAALAPEVADHEPAGALYAGADGLDAYRALAPLLPARIAPSGLACIEVGTGQAAAARALLEAQGLATATRADLAGIARCVTATRAPAVTRPQHRAA